MKPVQAGRRNTQGERNITNKPIYIKIYDKIKSAIKGGTMVMDTRTTQNYNQVTSLPEKDPRKKEMTPDIYML